MLKKKMAHLNLYNQPIIIISYAYCGPKSSKLFGGSFYPDQKVISNYLTIIQKK